MRFAERAQVDVVLRLRPPDLGLVGFFLPVLEEEDILIFSRIGLAQHQLECAEELDGLARLVDIIAHAVHPPLPFLGAEKVLCGFLCVTPSLFT